MENVFFTSRQLEDYPQHDDRPLPPPPNQTTRSAPSRHLPVHKAKSHLPRNAACDIGSVVRNDNQVAGRWDWGPPLQSFPGAPSWPRVPSLTWEPNATGLQCKDVAAAQTIH